MTHRHHMLDGTGRDKRGARWDSLRPAPPRLRPPAPSPRGGLVTVTPQNTKRLGP